jgi:hypothetical protein
MQELCCVQRNTISKCEVRYKAGCQYFWAVLQDVVRRTASETRNPNSRWTPASQQDSSSDRCRAQGLIYVLPVPPNPHFVQRTHISPEKWRTNS